MRESEICTGCGVCSFLCPVNAIDIKKENNTFQRKIHSECCVKCNKCINACHMNDSMRNNPYKAYIAESKKYRYRKRSASGGIASSIYEYGLNNNYVCVGAFFTEGRVKYDVIQNEEDILKCGGSKYVESHMDNLFGNIVNSTKGRIIFIGLPCHCAAFKKLVKDKNVEYILIDIVCNGVCDETKLAEDLGTHGINIKDIGDIRFREKNNQYGITVRNFDGDLIKKIEKSADSYMQEYERGVNIFTHCKDCVYSHKSRVGDITLKDYVWKYGVSNILVNTVRGEKFISNLEDSIYLTEYSLEKVVQDDKRIQ